MKYTRTRHAAHAMYSGEPRDVEAWHVLDQRHGRMRPSSVPPDAEYHHGYLDEQRRQVWVWMRSIPAPIGSVCNRCRHQ